MRDNGVFVVERTFKRNSALPENRRKKTALVRAVFEKSEALNGV
jgi:hypothetical protein